MAAISQLVGEQVDEMLDEQNTSSRASTSLAAWSSGIPPLV